MLDGLGLLILFSIVKVLLVILFVGIIIYAIIRFVSKKENEIEEDAKNIQNNDERRLKNNE